MMVKLGKQDDGKTVGDNAASLPTLAETSAKLFAEQTAAMAVFAAYGMSVATQMTGMMLGALGGPVQADAANKSEAEMRAGAAAGSNVVPLRSTETREPAPIGVAKTLARKTAAKKTPVGKPLTSKPATKAKAETTAQPATAPKPATNAVETPADDLKKIPGVGPRLEKVLNDRGIVRYDDLAGLNKAALKKLDGELGLEGRVIRDDWAGQARALSGGKG